MSTLVANKSHSFKEKEDQVPAMHQLFKPLVLNQSFTRRTESDITTVTNTTTIPLSSVNNDTNIPLIYPQFQLGTMPIKNMRQINPPFIYQENAGKKMVDVKNKPCCSCNKTKCIKKYCECFANNKCCTNCLCLDCRNKEVYIGWPGVDQGENTKNKTKEIIVCTCSKSGCNKKYCECYKEGLKCNIKCRCINCLNLPEDQSKNSNDKIISLDETKSESGKNASATKSESDGFHIQRISILINKSQTLINVEKLDKEEFNLLCKKRSKS